MSKSRREQNYPSKIVMMADLLLDLNMTSRSRSSTLDYLATMKNKQPEAFQELQANISQEQIRSDRLKRENKERSEERRMDTKEKDRTKKRLESFRKDSKGKAAMIGGLSRSLSRGGLAKTGSADYRKKGLFY
tara:strand:- start:1629 stop:2027 length:399 start_codon:yes stop_codon:yes gene_type:complete